MGGDLEYIIPNIYAVVCAAIFFGSLTCLAVFKYRKRKPIKHGKWISWSLATAIIRDHPAAKKHMMNMPIAENLEDFNEIYHGKPRRREHNEAVARAILDEIVDEFPTGKEGSPIQRGNNSPGTGQADD